MNKFMIYADNAATTKLDSDAYNAMLPFLIRDFGNASSVYSFSRSPKAAIEDARNQIANCLNASSDEIIFTSGGTESDNWAIKGIAFKHKHKGFHIIASSIEHPAVLKSCGFLEELGFNITYLSVDRKGVVSPNELRAALRPDTILVSIMLANNEIGTIQDIKKLAKISHLNNTFFHCDAVQAVGHIPINVKSLGVDLLSASAHKFNGPKGIGFLYLRKGTSVYNWLDGGSQEMGYRAGTENVAGIVGMAVALKKNFQNIRSNLRYLNELSKMLLARLEERQVDFILNGSSKRLPGNINISIRNKDGEAILHRLDLKKIIVSTGSACHSSKREISHVISAIGIPQEYSKGSIRISLGIGNTKEDVYKIANAIADIVSKEKIFY